MSTDKLRSFVADLVVTWEQTSLYDIDGGDLEAMMIKHGLYEVGQATQAECETKMGQDFQLEVGDAWNFHSDELKAAIAEFRSGEKQ